MTPEQIATPAGRSSRFLPALVTLAAFGLYWLSSFALEARDATTHFGADTWYYAELAEEHVIARIGSSYNLDRVARFHPTTVAIAAAWMKIFGSLTTWIAPIHLLKAMFAAVGAAGVWAALSGLAMVIPRRYVIPFGVIYAVSFGVWYFSSIEESKIVTTSLSTFYIASYLRLRRGWTMGAAVLLTAILLVACLNEMVSGFLIIIPIVDTLVQRGWDWRQGWWIVVHGLVGPIAFVILEGVMYGRLVAASHPEGASHFSMLFAYIARNSYDVASFYSFVVNWLFFNIAAPTSDASYGVPAGASYKGHVYKGYFEPALANYFSSPVSATLVVVFAGMIVASMLPRYRAKMSANLAGLLLGLTAYTLVRGVFFFIFNPSEALLFSPAATLAHLLMFSIPFTNSEYHAKGALLLAFAVLLFITNQAFIIGW